LSKLINGRAQSTQQPAVKSKRFRQKRGRVGIDGRKGFSVVEQLWTRPTLELNGIWAATRRRLEDRDSVQGLRENFSTRLVPNQDPDKITRLLERHIRKLLPKTVKFKLDVQARARPGLPYTHPFFEVAHEALEKGFGKRAVFIREGGSIPSSRKCTTR